MFMAGELSELECVVSGEVSLREMRADVLGGPVNPDAVELGAIDQVSIAVHTGPVAYVLNQALFDRVAKDVPHPVFLGCFI